MRKNVTLNLLFVLFVVTAGSLLTANKYSGSKGYHRASGAIVSIDFSSRVFSIKHGGARRLKYTARNEDTISTFKVTDSTKFRAVRFPEPLSSLILRNRTRFNQYLAARDDGEAISFTDLQVGDDVRVAYIEERGEKIASRVDVARGVDPSKINPKLPNCPKPKFHESRTT